MMILPPRFIGKNSLGLFKSVSDDSGSTKIMGERFNPDAKVRASIFVLRLMNDLPDSLSFDSTTILYNPFFSLNERAP